MSIKLNDTITCPKCGQVNDFTRWESLNGDLDPEAKQQLIDGTLFNFECVKCGHKSTIDYSILYHDAARRAMVYYADKKSAKQTKAIMEDTEKKLGFKMNGYRKRVVTDQNALREKAIIFEHELDDRVVEIIKLFYFAKSEEQFKEAKITAAYFLVSDDKYILEFVGDKRFSAELPSDMYNNIKNSFAERLAASGDNETVIDLNWAKRFLKK